VHITDDGLEPAARDLIRAEVSELIVVATSSVTGSAMSNSSTSVGGEGPNAA